MGDKKKIRGISRKFNAMKRRIEHLTENFPLEDNGYWHIHLPVAQAFIDSQKTPFSIRRKCIQLLIESVHHLISIRPEEVKKYKVVAAINLPELFDSQIIIFYEDNYYNSFFERNDDCQRWTLLPSTRNIYAEWNLRKLPNLGVRGYKEVIVDEDFSYEGEIWFIGEI